MNKYRIKAGCRIEHQGTKYSGGECLELDPELALFHAANIEVVKSVSRSEKVVLPKQDKLDADRES